MKTSPYTGAAGLILAAAQRALATARATHTAVRPAFPGAERAARAHTSHMVAATLRRRAHVREQFRAAREQRAEYLADRAKAYGVPNTRLGLWLLTHWHPLRLRSGATVWRELWHSRHYPAVFYTKGLTHTSAWL